MTEREHWKHARKILCIRLDNMGDVLMTTPAMRALKLAAPDRSITLLASPAGVALAPHMPFVDGTITYNAPWVKNADNCPMADEQTLQALHAGHFDAAVIFTVYSQSPLPAALLCRLAGIPLTLAHCRENPYWLLSDWVPETEPELDTRHEVQRQLDLVAQVQAVSPDPRLVFVTRSADRVSLRAKLRLRNIDPDGDWIVAHCGATAASRRYPPEHYVEALRQLGNRAGQVILTGNEAELAMTQQIAHQCADRVPCFDLAGTLTLGEFACLLEDASLLLSNNTGPVHIAAAVGTPVVDLYALTNPQHTPWMVPHRVLFHDVPCKYCYRSVCPQAHHDCLRLVAPETVCEAVTGLLADTRQRPQRRAVV